MAVSRSCKAYHEGLESVKADFADLKSRIEMFAKTGDRQLEREIFIFSRAVEINVEKEFKKIDPYRVELRRSLMKEFGLNVLPDAFEKGWALVGSEFFIKKDGSRLILDRDGIYIRNDFREGVAVGEDADGNPCFITDLGETIFQISDPDRSFRSPLKFEQIDRPSEGVVRVKLRGESGYEFIDLAHMRFIKPQSFQEITGSREFHEGKAAIKLDGTWRYMEKNGALSSMFYETYAGDFSEGVAWVQMSPLTRSSGNTFRLVDASGKPISPTYYKSGWKCSEGLVAAESSEGVWQFIDRQGNLAIDDLYENIDWNGFREGKCAVQKDGLWVFIGIDGKELFGGERFDRVISGFENGRAAVQQGADHFFIDEHGKKVLGPYNAIHQSFVEGVAQVVSDTAAPYIDWYGRPIYRED